MVDRGKVLAAKRGESNGFCRGEFLVILGILSLVAAFVFPMQITYQRKARRAMVVADFRAVIEACDRFQAEHGYWPTAMATDYGDVRYGLNKMPNSLVLNVLRAMDAEGNRMHSVNTNQTVYLEVELYEPNLSGLGPDGDFIDPWGEPYQIVVDADGDNNVLVEDSIYHRIPNEGLVLWSCGRDRMSDTWDDIVSWKQ